MATKTEQLRAALVARGFVPIDHVSQRECLRGATPGGAEIFVWPDKTGGARYAMTPRKTTAITLSNKTIGLLIEGKPSKLIAGGAA